MHCQHQMEIVSVGEHYFWQEDIYNLEVREVWECEKCGQVVNVPAEFATESVILDSSEYV